MQARDFNTVSELREAFPSAFLADGTVDLSYQRGIRTLARDMTVERDLILDECLNLVEIPDGLIVKGMLSCNHCRTLKRIGKAEVGGIFQVTGSESLCNINSNLKVGELHIVCCPRLAHIPDTVLVEGSVSLSYCENLIDVPWKTVNGNFSATACTSLSNLPPQFTVDGRLNISETRGLELRDDVTAPLIFARRCEGLTISESLMNRMPGRIDLEGSEYTLAGPSLEDSSPSPS